MKEEELWSDEHQQKKLAVAFFVLLVCRHWLAGVRVEGEEVQRGGRESPPELAEQRNNGWFPPTPVFHSDQEGERNIPRFWNTWL